MQPELPAVNKSRRRFIIGIGLTTAATTTGAAGLFALRDHQTPDYSDVAYNAWQQLKQGSLSDRQYMVLCATLAPSPHNTQPWKFHLSDHQIEILADTTRTLGAADPAYRQLQQGLGCAVENLLITARFLGYTATAEYQSVLQKDHPLAVTVTLESGAASVDESTFQAIFDRQTNRSAYDMSIPVPETLIADLKQLDNPSVGISMHRDGDLETAYIVSYIRQAVRKLVADDDYYHDSIEWWRYTRNELLDNKDGISIHTSDAPFFVKAGMEQLVDEEMWKGDFGRQGEVDVMDTIAQSTPAWGVIWGKGKSLEHRVKAGQVLEQAYLQATRQKLFLHPVSYAVEDSEMAYHFAQRFDMPAEHELLSVFRLGSATRMERAPRLAWQNRIV